MARPARRRPASASSPTSRGHNKQLGFGPPGRSDTGWRRGNAFERWFDDVLGGATFSAVRKPPENGQQSDDWWLKLIAVDVTSGRAARSTGRPAGATGTRARPADRSRRVQDLARCADEHVDPVLLRSGPSFRTRRDRRASIVDGGTLSNFPVWLWDVDPKVAGRPPSRPTFGFTLEGGKGFGGPGALGKVAPWELRFAFQIFHTAESAWDKRFVSNSTRVRTLAVDAGDVATTEFDLSTEKQEMLIRNGRAAATKFLDAFSLEEYENTYHAGLAQSPTGVTS